MWKRPLQIATDGGCRGNPGHGAWAFVVALGSSTDNLKGKAGHSELTTNNEMELKAVYEALTWLSKLNEPYDVTVMVDSAYVVTGYTQWMHNWKKNMWRTSSGGRVKNKQLWHDVYHLSKELEKTHTLTFQKVKGHSGHPMNEAADLRCNVLMDEYELNKF